MARSRIYTRNDSFFKHWSPEIAYTLGLIAADGCVVQTGRETGYWKVGLKSDDQHILESIRGFVGYDGPFHHRKAEGNNKAQTILQVSSAEMFNDLRAFGFTQHKSSELRWRDIPEPYLSHFVRGYFDGDGSVYLQQANNPRFKIIGANLVGTEHFIRGLHDAWVTTCGRQVGHVATLPTWSTLFFSGTDSTLAFLDWIYTDSAPETRLARKYAVYQDFLHSPLYAEFQQVKGIIGDMDWEIACALRTAWESGQTNLFTLSREFGINRTRIEAIVKNQTWLRSDGRRSDTFHDFTLDGKTKYWSEWAEDPRCLVDRDTLYHRLIKQGLGIQEAMTRTPDKGSAARTHVFTIHGETKGLRQWTQEVGKSYQTVYHRIFRMGLDPVLSLVAAPWELPRPEPQNFVNRKVQGNSRIDWDTAFAIRELRTEGRSLDQLVSEFGLTRDIVFGVISNETWTDPEWVDPIKREVSGTILVDWDGGSVTLTALAALTGVPKVTLDKRYRDGLRGLDLVAAPRKRMNADAAKLIREDYKVGLVGQPLYAKHGVTEAAAIQVLSNRSFAEGTIWWK